MKRKYCMKKRFIYDEVDANEETYKECFIKGKRFNEESFTNVAVFSKNDGTVEYLNKTACFDFLVNEMIYGLKRINGY